MAAIIADIMRTEGKNIYFYTKLRGFENLVRSVRRDRIFLDYNYVFFYDRPEYSIPLASLGKKHYIDAFFEFNGIPHKYQGQTADVITKDIHAPVVDVAMSTRCSNFSTKRLWPHFTTLKDRLRREGISYIDLDDLDLSYTDPLTSMKALAIVRNANLYLGLDSGMSHYVARVVRRALILQSGYSYFENWCNYPRFECLQVDIECRPCWISEDNPKQCPYDENACMVRLAPDHVFEHIRQILN